MLKTVQQPPVELCGDALEFFDFGVEPVEDRRHVHVGDPPQPDHDMAPSAMSGDSPGTWP